MIDDPAAWRPDPTGRFDHRYWDGTQWTDHVATAGIAATDAYSSLIDATVVEPPAPTDPTLATPAAPADQTSIWPAPPIPAYSPADQATLAAASATSKKRLLVGAGIILAVGAVVAAVAMSGDDPKDPIASSDTTTTTTIESASTTSPLGILPEDVPADFEQRLADVYETSLGLPREKARCLAGKLREAVTSGNITQQQAMSDVVEFLAACNINLNELSGN